MTLDRRAVNESQHDTDETKNTTLYFVEDGGSGSLSLQVTKSVGAAYTIGNSYDVEVAP